MLYRTLGKTNHKASFLGFGGAGLSGDGGGYGFGSMSENEAKSLIFKALDYGINTFDTAPIYGFGVSEQRLGKYLPKNSFIVTKGGVDWHENKRVNMSNDPKIIEKMLNQSLQRLNREVIDVYMIHWPDPKFPIEAPLEVLIRAKKEGKILHIGLCNTNEDDLNRSLKLTRIELIQSQYNYFTPNSIKDLKPLLDAHQIGFMSWGTFDKGILSGRVDLERKFESSDARSWAPWWKAQNLEEKLQKLEKLKSIGQKLNLTLPELAIGHQFICTEVSSCLIGWKNIQDLDSNIKNLEKIQSYIDNHKHLLFD